MSVEILRSELKKLIKRVEGQKKILAESQKALEAAIVAKMPSLMVTVDARVKRQAEALRVGQSAIKELEDAIAVADSPQMDIEDNKNPPAAGRRR